VEEYSIYRIWAGICCNTPVACTTGKRTEFFNLLVSSTSLTSILESRVAFPLTCVAWCQFGEIQEAERGKKGREKNSGEREINGLSSG
jgi:hypothetical protein